MTYLKFNRPEFKSELNQSLLRKNFMNEYLGKQNDCYSAAEPRYKVEDSEGSYVLTMAVPGLAKEDLSIGVENNILTIKTIEKENESNDSFLISAFEKQFRLSKKVDQESIEAQTVNGVLSVTLPKVAEEKKEPARMIEIA